LAPPSQHWIFALLILRDTKINMKIRSNFYLDTNRLDALKELAKHEETSISDLVREGIDRVISERMNSPKRERNALRENVQAFMDRYAGTGPESSLEEIDALVRPSKRKPAKV